MARGEILKQVQDDHQLYSVVFCYIEEHKFISGLYSSLKSSPLTAQRHEFNPSVVAIAERILITVWMISFQVSLFFIRSLVKGLVFSLFYFGYWLLAIGC